METEPYDGAVFHHDARLLSSPASEPDIITQLMSTPSWLRGAEASQRAFCHSVKTAIADHLEAMRSAPFTIAELHRHGDTGLHQPFRRRAVF